MVGQLSDLLRHSMDSASTPEVPLRAELDLLERYLGIMRVRFQGHLDVVTRADPCVLDALVPNMILQPLIENAIKHGVEQLVDGGRIEVEATRDGDVLVLRVRDNGPGVASHGTDEQADVRAGVGLTNTEARLAQLYGSAHRFSLGPDPVGGTLAEIRLPFRTGVTAAEVSPAAAEPRPDGGVARVG